MVEYDFIIAGAGTSGCVVARRLVERTEARVLVLEAGPPYPRLLLDPPLPGMKFGRSRTWGQVSVAQARLGGRQIVWPMGKVVGGTSSVNAMVAFRGHPANFDAWAAAGNPGWSSRELAPCFLRALGSVPEGPLAEVAGGVLSLSPPRFRSAFSEAFLDACVEDGMVRESPLLGREGGRCGFFPVLQRNGARFESARGYLEAVRSHPRLTLRTGCHVLRVLVEGGRAAGVEIAEGGRIECFRAASGVILCAGVFQTPRILQCSGLGPEKVLRGAGIRTRLDLPGVGENLHDHVRVGMFYRTNQISPGRRRFWGRGLWCYLLRRDGVMASNCCESGAFLSSSPGSKVPDIELITHFQTFGPEGEVDIEVSLVAPRSRGRLMVNPRDVFGPPLVDPNFLAEEQDVLALQAGVRRVQSIVSRRALREFPLLEEAGPASRARSEAGRREAVFQTATTAYHPCGSCAMGGAIDPDLRVLGMENLWVADASAMPTVPTGNIACAVVVLGEKASDLILGAG